MNAEQEQNRNMQACFWRHFRKDVRGLNPGFAKGTGRVLSLGGERRETGRSFSLFLVEN